MKQILNEIEGNPNWNYAILRVTYNQKDIDDVIEFAEIRIDERGYDLFSLFFILFGFFRVYHMFSFRSFKNKLYPLLWWCCKPYVWF